MSEIRKMDYHERRSAERIVEDAKVVANKLNRIYENMDFLLDERGWDPPTWIISKAAMLVAESALDVAQKIIDDDHAEELAKEMKEDE